MPSTRLTRETRDHIICKVQPTLFEAHFKALEERRAVLSERVYRCMVTEDQEKLMRSLPAGFCNTQGAVAQIRNDWSSAHAIRVVWEHAGVQKTGEFYLDFGDRPLPRVQGHAAPIDIPKRLFDDLNKLASDCADTRKQRDQAFNKFQQFLGQFSTIEKLVAAWPEGEAYIPKPSVVASGGALAIRSEDITKLLKKAGSLPPPTELAKAA